MFAFYRRICILRSVLLVIVNVYFIAFVLSAEAFFVLEKKEEQVHIETGNFDKICILVYIDKRLPLKQMPERLERD